MRTEKFSETQVSKNKTKVCGTFDLRKASGWKTWRARAGIPCARKWRARTQTPAAVWPSEDQGDSALAEAQRKVILHRNNPPRPHKAPQAYFFHSSTHQILNSALVQASFIGIVQQISSAFCCRWLNTGSNEIITPKIDIIAKLGVFIAVVWSPCSGPALRWAKSEANTFFCQGILKYLCKSIAYATRPDILGNLLHLQTRSCRSPCSPCRLFTPLQTGS